MSPRILDRPAPDPARAHGAWVYLGMSILAGSLSAGSRGLLAALASGLVFVGVFLVASALALYPRPWKRRLLGGLALGGVAGALGLYFGADPWFCAYASVALFPAAASVWFAMREGFLSPVALAFAVVALTVSAPAAACAGGMDPRLGWMLLVLLAPFFAWRTWTVRRLLTDRKGMGRAEIRSVGLREAVIAATWTMGTVAAVHLF